MVDECQLRGSDLRGRLTGVNCSTPDDPKKRNEFYRPTRSSDGPETLLYAQASKIETADSLGIVASPSIKAGARTLCAAGPR